MNSATNVQKLWNYCVKIEVLNRTRHLSCALLLNCFHFGNSCCPVQFTTGVNIF